MDVLETSNLLTLLNTAIFDTDDIKVCDRTTEGDSFGKRLSTASDAAHSVLNGILL